MKYRHYKNLDASLTAVPRLSQNSVPRSFSSISNPTGGGFSTLSPLGSAASNFSSGGEGEEGTNGGGGGGGGRGRSLPSPNTIRQLEMVKGQLTDCLRALAVSFGEVGYCQGGSGFRLVCLFVRSLLVLGRVAEGVVYRVSVNVSVACSSARVGVAEVAFVRLFESSSNACPFSRCRCHLVFVLPARFSFGLCTKPVRYTVS